MNQFIKSSYLFSSRKNKKKKKPHHSVVLFGVLLLLFFPLFVFTQKGDVILYINQHHDSWSDAFFRNVTHLGDGLVFIPLLLCFIFIRYYYSVLLVAMAVGNGLVSAFLKRGIFGPEPRPRKFFQEMIDQIHFVDGVKVYSSYSFPSGHTATAFMVAILLSLIINKKSWSLVFLAYAVVVGISRIYLFQHFFQDVFFGATVGCFSAYAIYFWFENSWFKRSNRLHGKLNVMVRHIPLPVERGLESVTA